MESIIKPTLTHRLQLMAMSGIFSTFVGCAELYAIQREKGESSTTSSEFDCNYNINMSVATLKLFIGCCTFINYVGVQHICCLEKHVKCDEWNNPVTAAEGGLKAAYNKRHALLSKMREFEKIPPSVSRYNMFSTFVMVTQIVLGIVASSYAPEGGQPFYQALPDGNHARVNGLCVITTLQISYVLALMIWYAQRVSHSSEVCV